MRAVIITLAFGLFSVQAAHAADPRSTHVCFDPSSLASQRECQATFDAALQSANDTEQVVVTAQSMGTPTDGRFRGVQPLQFQKRAPWVRRLEKLGKEGIPFFRVPRGPENELVVGINRKGVLGFEMKPVNR